MTSVISLEGWFNVKAIEKKTLNKIIDVEKKYSFQPYLYTHRGVTPILYELSGEVLMVPRVGIPPVV